MDFSTQKHKTENPYEKEFGYSRAVRRGPFIFVSGTTSVEPTTGKVLYPESAYQQAQTTFAEILLAIRALGGSKDDVVRLRLFVNAEEDIGGVSRAMRDAFGDIEPAATMIVGVKFVSPEMKVEIEADAVVLWYISPDIC